MHGEESGPQISGYRDLMADLKQSLVDPDGDFVQMVDLDEQAKTVIMTKGTTSKVKESRRVNLSKDEDEDEDDEGRRRRQQR